MGAILHRRQVLAMMVAGAVGLGGLPTAMRAAAQTAAAARGVTPGPGENELTVTHFQGETVVPRNPEVVLSFDVASIDTLQSLGVRVDGMPELTTGADRYAAEDAITIGSLFEPDYEAVNAAEPDLIIVAGRSSEAYGELSKIAPTIDLTFSGQNFLDDFRANVTILAEIFGKRAEAEAILADIDARIEALREHTATIGTGLVIMTTGGSVTALAPGSARAGRGALIYETLGVRPPLEDIEEATHGEPISFEFLLEHDPDWLFVIDRDAATGEEGGQPAEQVLDNDLVHQTTAWRQDQIVYLDPFDWYIITGAGLDSMQRMLDELEAAFGL